MPREGLLVEQCSSPASTAVGLGGVAQRGLGNRSVLMDACRTVVLSGVVAASTAGYTRLLR